MEKRIHNETYLRGDIPCMDCGIKDNTIWSTKNVFWNEVMEGVKGSGILCIKCFTRRAEKKIKVQGWFILPEFYENPKLPEHGAGSKCPIDMCKKCFKIDNQ